MSIKKIKKHNSEQFLIDLKRVRTFVVDAQVSEFYFTISKKEVIKAACDKEIFYTISDKIFMNRRDVMIII